MTPLTTRQREVLDFIRTATERNGYPPSIREMCAAFKIGSPNGLRATLSAMQRKGWIRWKVNQARTITVIEDDVFRTVWGAVPVEVSNR